MAKIHGLVYIIVGLFVSVFSWKVNYEKFIFFFYVGLVFVFVGVIKIGFNLVNKKDDKTEIAGSKQQRSQHHLSAQHQSQRFRYCSRCRNAARLHDIFCSRCGTRL